MPLRPARVGRVGVIGHPVAKTAVVARQGPKTFKALQGGSPPPDLTPCCCAWQYLAPRHLASFCALRRLHAAAGDGGASVALS